MEKLFISGNIIWALTVYQFSVLPSKLIFVNGNLIIGFNLGMVSIILASGFNF